MLTEKIIEIAPMAYMRGRTFKNTWIVADECQNTNVNQFKMLLTRLGENSRMVITGDLKQSDKGLDSGLNDFINKFKVYEKRESEKYNNTDINTGIKMVELNNTDIERSPVIVKILDVYSVNENKVEKNSYLQSSSSVTPSNTIRLIPTKKPTERGTRKKGGIDNDAAMIPFDQLKEL